MEFEKKLYVLNQLHNAYHRFSAGLSVACEASCCHCCTGNVTVTSLEGCLIVDRLISSNQLEILNKINRAEHRKRFQPKMTTNMLAALCAKGQPVPEEYNNASWGECPLVEDSLCPIYRVRPFGCRCFVSRQPCGESGFADVDPFVLSVNTLFLQFIEHIDADGYTANLTDMLGMMESDTHREQFRKGRLELADEAFIPNQPISIYYIPPEHQQRIKPILESLQRIRVPM